MFDFTSYRNHTACISADGHQDTYGDLEHLARQIAIFAEQRQLVFCLCSNSIGSVAGYAAFVNNNDASLLLDAHISRDSFESLVRTYHPRYIWAPCKSHLTHDTDLLFEAEGYALYQTDNSAPVAEGLAVLLATSGSTGSPKMVRLSKENLRSNALSIIEYLHITDRERPILGLPMNYAYGLSIVNSHLLSGATLLLTEASFVEREFLQFANANGFTSFSGVPYAYEIIHRMGIWRQEMPTLRTLTLSGGKLSNDLIRFFDETFTPRGVKFYVMYGQAEATTRISYLEPECMKERTGSIGKAIPGGRMSLVDEAGSRILSPDTIGELVYEGPNVSLGYAECAEDLLKGDENHGVIHTGDMAYRDSDGFYYIAGRKSRFVKLYGHRISLDHAAELLCPLLTECVCVGDDTRIVICTTDAGYDEHEVIDLISSRTRIPRKAFSVQHIEAIPRSNAGKVLYKELNDLWITQ